jgi:hypothetical protein
MVYVTEIIKLFEKTKEKSQCSLCALWLIFLLAREIIQSEIWGLLNHAL